ncbi:hypothetical protein GOV10_00030 [Candidatus Woesearchaeota archaeon]|nr:hypothetical protein [Candidatus Woesearchaeota archaeon]
MFTIIYAILQKVKVFGKGPETKKYSVVIALVLGIIFVVVAQDLVYIMLQAVPNVSIVIIAILMALLIIGMLGKRVELGGNSLSGWIAFMAFLLVVYIFGAAARWWDSYWFGWLVSDPEIVALVVTILVFAIIIWFVTHEPKEKDDDKKFGKQFANLLKGGDDD